MTKAEFDKHAEQLKLTLGQFAQYLPPREFSSGNRGWYGNAKADFNVEGEQLRAQISISVVVIGSKDWADTPAELIHPDATKPLAADEPYRLTPAPVVPSIPAPSPGSPSVPPTVAPTSHPPVPSTESLADKRKRQRKGKVLGG